MKFNRGDTIKGVRVIQHEKLNPEYGFMFYSTMIDDYTNIYDLINYKGCYHVNFYIDEVRSSKVLLTEKSINGI